MHKWQITGTKSAIIQLDQPELANAGHCGLVAYKTILAVLELLIVNFTIFRYFKRLRIALNHSYCLRVPRW